MVVDPWEKERRVELSGGDWSSNRDPDTAETLSGPVVRDATLKPQETVTHQSQNTDAAYPGFPGVDAALDAELGNAIRSRPRENSIQVDSQGNMDTCLRSLEPSNPGGGA
jgi:hypothetical protein